MKIRWLAAAALSVVVPPVIAHDSAAHLRRAPAVPAECAAFVGKDPVAIDLKDLTVKAAPDKCEATRKDATKADEAESGHER